MVEALQSITRPIKVMKNTSMIWRSGDSWRRHGRNFPGCRRRFVQELWDISWVGAALGTSGIHPRLRPTGTCQVAGDSLVDSTAWTPVGERGLTCGWRPHTKPYTFVLVLLGWPAPAHGRDPPYRRPIPSIYINLLRFRNSQGKGDIRTALFTLTYQNSYQHTLFLLP